MNDAEKKYNELFMKNRNPIEGVPKANRIKNAIDYFVNNSCEHFSFTKVFPVSYVAQQYLRLLMDINKVGDANATSWHYLNHNGAMPTTSFPLLIMLVAESSGTVIDASAELVRMIEECPEGHLDECLRKFYETHWGGIKKYEQRMEEIKQALEKTKCDRVLQIGYGPIFLDKDKVKEISGLFLFPEWHKAPEMEHSGRPSSWGR